MVAPDLSHSCVYSPEEVEFLRAIVRNTVRDRKISHLLPADVEQIDQVQMLPRLHERPGVVMWSLPEPDAISAGAQLAKEGMSVRMVEADRLVEVR
jgi:hypothetical protein